MAVALKAFPIEKPEDVNLILGQPISSRRSKIFTKRWWRRCRGSSSGWRFVKRPAFAWPAGAGRMKNWSSWPGRTHWRSERA